MTKSEAIEHFGSQKKLRELTGRSKSTVSEWKEELPRSVQFELHVKSYGLLQVDKKYL